MKEARPYGEPYMVGNWVLTHESRRTVKVVNLKTWVTDYPVQYLDGEIGYDRPEAIPAYIKRKVEDLFAGRI